MPLIDFKEIPAANLASGNQDTFELFARDFLETLGYEILSEPNRGRDGGKDLIVLETRTGVGGKSFVKWLVSCKHKAHSGNSVTADDESRLSDRISQHGCNGFIGFYSTLPNSSLSDTLEGIKRNKSNFEFQIFDKEKIEANLLKNQDLHILIARYFPISCESHKLSSVGLNIIIAHSPKMAENKEIIKELVKKEPSLTQILEHSKKRPIIALIHLLNLLENESKIVIASMELRPRGRMIGSYAILLLENKAFLPDTTRSYLKKVRQLIENSEQKDESEVSQISEMIEIGLDFLKIIRAIPREIHTVQDVIEIYKDDKCLTQKRGVRGLILKTKINGRICNQIFQTELIEHYNIGERIFIE